jgi:hypothetical protein
MWILLLYKLMRATSPVNQKEQIMSNNYEWQKHQANERVQARFQEAEAHRQSKHTRDERPLLTTLKMIVMVGVGVIVAIWMLAGCTTPVVEAYPNADVSGWTLAEQIHFQDERDQEMAWTIADSSQAETTPTWTMADRIRFQDQIEAERPLSK